MDRRSLIKRGAAAGAAAWTAPLILDSVVSPAGAQSAPPPPPPDPVATGIRFVNASTSSNAGAFAVTLTYGGPPTATTATSSPPVPGGNTRQYTASVQLIDQNGDPFANDSGGSIVVGITRSGGNGGPTPNSLTILNGASVSSGSTTMTFANGSTQGSLNASATVSLVAVTATVSTTTP